MKLSLPSLMLILLFVTACTKDKTNGLAGRNTLTADTSTATIKLQGLFTPTAGIVVNGKAIVLSDGQNFSLKLDGFFVSQGPDLKVYLSRADVPTDFINLGPLRNNSGNDVYAIPSGVDFREHKYALIHCQQFNHLFAIALLSP